MHPRSYDQCFKLFLYNMLDSKCKYLKEILAFFLLSIEKMIHLKIVTASPASQLPIAFSAECCSMKWLSPGCSAIINQCEDIKLTFVCVCVGGDLNILPTTSTLQRETFFSNILLIKYKHNESSLFLGKEKKLSKKNLHPTPNESAFLSISYIFGI